jgi:hypothetical protein
MSAVADSARSVSSLVIAALLLTAREFLRRLELPHPTVGQIVTATAATRSRAYELKGALVELLATLHRGPGRPTKPTPAPSSDVTAQLKGAMLRFVIARPGCVSGGEVRRHYTDELRAFVVELRTRYPQLSTEAFATAIELPVGTVAGWLHAASSAEPTCKPSAADDSQADQQPTNDGTEVAPASVHVETVLNAWKRWRGGFIDFCDHVQQHWRVPFRRTLIARILEAYGVRLPRRRPRRSPDEEALRGSFKTFFPGAQWVGDGSAIEVVIDGEVLTLNLELMVDTDTDAMAGMSIREQEDSAAVTEAVADGVLTTEGAPLGLLLDNKPSNHTPEVDAALGETTRIRATPNRPQNKAHVEGAFGLFQQTAPPLELTTHDSVQTAKQLLTIVAIVWARTLNHRPRADRLGRSRVDLYAEQPTDEQIAHARAALEERCRRKQLARRTLEARQDPVVRQTLDDAFARLGLADPERHFRNAIARYPLDAIVAAIATFTGKREAGTLPDGVDARYLLGIARNIANQNEGLAIANALLRERLAARDRSLAALQRKLDDTRSDTGDPGDQLRSFIDRALDCPRRIDQLFWLDAASDIIAAHDDSLSLYGMASARIHTAFRVPYRQRLEAVNVIAEKVVPLM